MLTHREDLAWVPIEACSRRRRSKLVQIAGRQDDVDACGGSVCLCSGKCYLLGGKPQKSTAPLVSAALRILREQWVRIALLQPHYRQLQTPLDLLIAAQTQADPRHILGL